MIPISDTYIEPSGPIATPVGEEPTGSVVAAPARVTIFIQPFPVSATTSVLGAFQATPQGVLRFDRSVSMRHVAFAIGGVNVGLCCVNV
jgi:hypothetical protein